MRSEQQKRLVRGFGVLRCGLFLCVWKKKKINPQAGFICASKQGGKKDKNNQFVVLGTVEWKAGKDMFTSTSGPPASFLHCWGVAEDGSQPRSG